MQEFAPISSGECLLLEKIAVAGTTQLYRVKMTGVQAFEKLIAIKKIIPQLSAKEELAKTFLEEAKLAALLKHRNIVQVYDFGLMEDYFFVVMEYLFGKDLRQVLNKSREKGVPLSPGHALYIASRICSGLDYAHKLTDFQGEPYHIVHGNIRPSNILTTYEGEVKILDFGISKAPALSEGPPPQGMIEGQVAYISPEQASGDKVDRRSDLFSTGILLYEMVTQKRLYSGNSLQMLEKVRLAEFDPPEIALPGLPPKLCRLLHRALAREIDQRYQSCGEMLADIEECLLDLSRRPTSQGVAETMKKLFAEEIETEEWILQKIEAEGVDKDTVLTKDMEAVEKILKKVKAVSEEEVTAKRKKKFYFYPALAIALALLAAFWVFASREKPGPPPGGENGPYSYSEPSEGRGPAAAALSSASPQRAQEPGRDAGGKTFPGPQPAAEEARDKETP